MFGKVLIYSCKLRFFLTFFVQPCLKAGLKVGFQQCGE
jgi:hypothetical protein